MRRVAILLSILFVGALGACAAILGIDDSEEPAGDAGGGGDTAAGGDGAIASLSDCAGQQEDVCRLARVGGVVTAWAVCQDARPGGGDPAVLVARDEGGSKFERITLPVHHAQPPIGLDGSSPTKLACSRHTSLKAIASDDLDTVIVSRESAGQPYEVLLLDADGGLAQTVASPAGTDVVNALAASGVYVAAAYTNQPHTARLTHYMEIERESGAGGAGDSGGPLPPGTFVLRHLANSVVFESAVAVEMQESLGATLTPFEGSTVRVVGDVLNPADSGVKVQASGTPVPALRLFPGNSPGPPWIAWVTSGDEATIHATKHDEGVTSEARGSLGMSAPSSWEVLSASVDRNKLEAKIVATVRDGERSEVVTVATIATAPTRRLTVDTPHVELRRAGAYTLLFAKSEAGELEILRMKTSWLLESNESL